MALIYETAYPRLKSSFTDKELELNFTPTEDDLLLMKLNTKRLSIVTQLGFLVTLKCYQCLGRPILTKKASPQIKFHIAKKINIENVQLTEYDRSSARKRHIKSIRKYLCVSEDKQARRTAMKKIVISSSETKENLADIINDIIEELVRLRFELPIFRILLRLSMAARKVVSNHHYEKVNALLSKENIEFIENLFKVTAGVSQWNQLKQEPKSPTANNVKIFIEQVNQLKKLKEKININIDFVSVNRISQYVSEAISLDASNMRDLKPSRRYFLAIILIIFKTSSAMDDLISIFIRWIRKLHTDGKESLNHYRLTHASETDDLVCLLHRILNNLKIDATAPERLYAIESCVAQGVDEAIAQCEKHIAYSNDNYFSFMLKPYRNKRYLIFNLLDQLDIKSSSQDISIEAAINFIKIHRNSHKVWLDIKYNDEQDRSSTLDLSWLPEKWFKAVTGKTKGSQVYQIDRKYFELAVLSVLVDELDCGDVYVSDADIYNDQNKNLIDWDQFHQTYPIKNPILMVEHVFRPCGGY